MADKGAHPGVKSLLARFENNQQTAAASPPRDRSPAGSENLAKVRASFIAVDGGAPGSPVMGLRRISPHSEGPPTPARVKSFSSEDLDSSVKSDGSSPQTSNDLGSEQNLNEAETKDTVQESIQTEVKGEPEMPTSADKENQPAPGPPTSASDSLAVKPTKAVSKKPSNVGKTSSTTKPASQAPGSKSSTQSHAAAKPDNEKITRTARASRPSTTTSRNDPPKAPVQKPSRTSLATAARTSTTKTSRASTPARETARSTTRASDVRSSSTARSSRLASSATAPSQTSAAKSSAGGGSTSSLSRKPSTLKSTTTTVRQRAGTPTAASVRKQTSRSPPGKSGSRPHSRESTASKAVDEGFLARMMRPTASSASKTHEKVDIKSPPRSNATARAPRRVPSKLDTRSSRPMKEKIATEPLKKKAPTATAAGVDRKVKEQKAVSAHEQVPEHTDPEVPAEPSSQTSEPPVDVKKSNEETSAESSVETAAEPAVEQVESHDDRETGDIQSAQQGTESLVRASTSPTTDDNAESAEAPVEPASEVPEEQVPGPAENTTDEPAAPEQTDSAETIVETAETAEAVDNSQPEATPAVLEMEDRPMETGPKPNEVDVDINKLTLNDQDTY